MPILPKSSCTRAHGKLRGSRQNAGPIQDRSVEIRQRDHPLKVPNPKPKVHRARDAQGHLRWAAHRRPARLRPARSSPPPPHRRGGAPPLQIAFTNPSTSPAKSAFVRPNPTHASTLHQLSTFDIPRYPAPLSLILPARPKCRAPPLVLPPARTKCRAPTSGGLMDLQPFRLVVVTRGARSAVAQTAPVVSWGVWWMQTKRPHPDRVRFGTLRGAGASMRHQTPQETERPIGVNPDRS